MKYGGNKYEQINQRSSAKSFYGVLVTLHLKSRDSTLDRIFVQTILKRLGNAPFFTVTLDHATVGLCDAQGADFVENGDREYVNH